MPNHNAQRPYLREPYHVRALYPPIHRTDIPRSLPSILPPSNSLLSERHPSALRGLEVPASLANCSTGKMSKHWRQPWRILIFKRSWNTVPRNGTLGLLSRMGVIRNDDQGPQELFLVLITECLLFNGTMFADEVTKSSTGGKARYRWLL